jgi:hypothetical protein
MGVRKTQLMNAIPQGKFGLSANIQTGRPPNYEIANFMQNFNSGRKFYIK